MFNSNIQNLIEIINIFTYLNDIIKEKINKETSEISNEILKNIVCPTRSLPNFSNIKLEKYKDSNIIISKNDIYEIYKNIGDKLKESSIKNKIELNKTEEEINIAVNKFKNNENLLLLYENFTNQIEIIKNLNDTNILESILCPSYNESLIPLFENKTINIHILYITLNNITYIINLYTSLINNIPISLIYGDEHLINTILLRPIIIKLIKKPIVSYIQNYLETKIKDANKNQIDIDTSLFNTITCKTGVSIPTIKKLTKVDDILFLNDNITTFNYKTLINSCFLNVEQNINKNIDDPIFESFFKSKIEKEKTIKNAKKILYNLNDNVINKYYNEFKSSIINNNSLTGSLLQDVLCSNLVDFNKNTQNIQALAVAIYCSYGLTKLILQIGLDVYKNPTKDLPDVDICKKEFDTYKNSMENDYSLIRNKLDECNIKNSKYEIELKNSTEKNCNDSFYIILLSISSFLIIIFIGIVIFLGYKLYKNISIPKKD